jgi:cobalt-zinc-cadmium efflux system membrane fusion protein
MQEAAQRAQRQALLLHGLSAEQVETILSERKLLQTLTIKAPSIDEPVMQNQPPALQVEQVKVDPGQNVVTGETLAVLANHAELHLEGSAFEQDVDAIHRAAAKDWSVAALLESQAHEPEVIHGLKILYLSNRVDTDTRAYHFYVTFPNELLRESRTPDDRRLVYWRYKPGQRAHILVPVERWQERIVLPVTAVALEGAEAYVFVPNGERFERRPVHVEHRDQLWAVLAPDGSLYPGETVVKSGAHQLQLAIKNKSGGGIDPHAGHSH